MEEGVDAFPSDEASDEDNKRGAEDGQKQEKKLRDPVEKLFSLIDLYFLRF